jgi:hypothetical protein
MVTISSFEMYRTTRRHSLQKVTLYVHYTSTIGKPISVFATCFTLAYYSTLKIYCSETSADFQRTTQRYIAEDNFLRHRFPLNWGGAMQSALTVGECSVRIQHSRDCTSFTCYIASRHSEYHNNNSDHMCFMYALVTRWDSSGSGEVTVAENL